MVPAPSMTACGWMPPSGVRRTVGGAAALATPATSRRAAVKKMRNRSMRFPLSCETKRLPTIVHADWAGGSVRFLGAGCHVADALGHPAAEQLPVAVGMSLLQRLDVDCAFLGRDAVLVDRRRNQQRLIERLPGRVFVYLDDDYLLPATSLG